MSNATARAAYFDHKRAERARYYTTRPRLPSWLPPPNVCPACLSLGCHCMQCGAPCTRECVCSYDERDNEGDDHV